MKKILSLQTLMLTLSSCIKDELPNMECDIMAAYAGVEAPDEVFFQLSDTLAPINADYASEMIQFQRVTPWADLSKAAPRFVLSPGAIIYPESGTVRDFSNDTTHVYFCIAEDCIPMFREMQTNGLSVEQQLLKASQEGKHIRTYFVQFKHSRTEAADVVEYNFENYFLEKKKQKYYEWSDLYPDGTEREVPNWATANAGFATARGSALPEEYPTVPLQGQGVDGGNCVKLETSSTGAFGELFGMPLAAGNLYLGTFNLSMALTNTLKATRFGENSTLDRKPIKMTGFYRYFPGTQMTDSNGTPVSGIDCPALYCVVYKNHDAQGNSVVLYGDDISTSALVVARAEVKEWKVNTDDWVPFSLDFDWREPLDEALLKAKGYNFAIVCSSSKDGAEFIGAIGSKLYVDNFKLYYEPEQ